MSNLLQWFFLSLFLYLSSFEASYSYLFILKSFLLPQYLLELKLTVCTEKLVGFFLTSQGKEDIFHAQVEGVKFLFNCQLLVLFNFPCQFCSYKGSLLMISISLYPSLIGVITPLIDFKIKPYGASQIDPKSSAYIT